MKTTIAMLVVAGACAWGEPVAAQVSQPAAPPSPTPPGATDGKAAESPPGTAAAEERYPIALRLSPLAVIEALAEAAQLDVEVDPRIRNGADGSGRPIPNWAEPVVRQWENKTPREALEEFLAGYKQVLIPKPGTSKFLVTYPEAQAKPPDQVAAKPSETKPEAAPPAPTEPLDRVLEMLSLDDTVPEAIRTVATKGKMNISIDPAVMVASQPGGKGPDGKDMPALTNKVVETWQNVTVRGAMEAILAPRGLVMIQYSNTPIPTVTFKPTKEPTFSRVITLKYANVTNLLSVLTNAISTNVTAKEDLRTSSLIVKATEKDFEAIDALLLKLDVPTRNVLIEAQIVETSRNPKAIRGIDWTKSLEAQELLGGFGRQETTITPGTPTTLPGGRVIPGTPTSATSITFH